MTLPPHHLLDGRFKNPWPEASGDDALRKRFRRVVWEWLTRPMPPSPAPDELPVAEPAIARPIVEDGDARITWVGHATFLLQLPGLNIVTDPVWSKRASPVSWMGVKRFVPPVPSLAELPPVQAVLISHDHYDHLDRTTVRALARRFPDLFWLTPLGYADWFSRTGARRVVECDWWDEVEIPQTDYKVVAAPARHWTRRTPWSTNTRLWCSWAVLPRSSNGGRVFFAGDSGYGSLFGEIGDRLGPFDASIIPIGAYDPRWFMSAAHMNPEEAVEAYGDIGGTGLFVPAHWGTFRLTFEPPMEPPERLIAAWNAAGFPRDALRLFAHGETARLDIP